MKILKVVGILISVYLVLVVGFESMLGYFQPENQSTLVIHTNTDGVVNSRVLVRIEHADQLYVAVNHWPRAWYYATIENPNVSITIEGNKSEYLAYSVDDEKEASDVDAANPLGLGFRFLTGFPPRYFVRLERK